MSLKQVSALADVVGIEAALILSAYFGGRNLYVPPTIPPEHELVNIVGARTASLMARHMGGETHTIPLLDLQPLRNRGLTVYLATQHQIDAPWIARLLKLSERRVRQYLQEANVQRRANEITLGWQHMDEPAMANQMVRWGVPVRVVAAAMQVSEPRVREWVTPSAGRRPTRCPIQRKLPLRFKREPKRKRPKPPGTL